MKSNCSSKASEIIDGMLANNINLLGVDFDLTLCSIHTGGRFPGTAEELSTYIRPFMIDFLPSVISRGIHVAIVTFSKQTTLIGSVLGIIFGKELAKKIVIRGNDGTWEHRGRSLYVPLCSHVHNTLTSYISICVLASCCY